MSFMRGDAAEGEGRCGPRYGDAAGAGGNDVEQAVFITTI